MASVLAFDIETVPDAELIRSGHGFSAAVPDEEAVEMAKRLRRQEGKSDFFPPAFQKVVTIGCVLRHADGGANEPFRVFSLAEPEYDEAGMVAMFFKIIEKYTPQLVSWNGGGFDLPVLNYRAMKYGIAAARYWQSRGNDDEGDKFQFNNYVSRYHERHLDVMDALSLYSWGGRAGLDDVARLCGLPGKIGIGGANVEAAWRAGKHKEIADYCEADALLTYLLYVRFQHFRGRFTGMDDEYRSVREYLEEENKRDGTDKWREFLNQWECG